MITGNVKDCQKYGAVHEGIKQAFEVLETIEFGKKHKRYDGEFFRSHPFGRRRSGEQEAL